MNIFDGYLTLCEQYDSMAQSFYIQYLDVKKRYEITPNEVSIKKMETYIGSLQSAICAVVFEALAIEAYVNFWGAYYWGDYFYQENDIQKRNSTIDKIKWICKISCNSKYPTDGEHYRTLKGLLKKEIVWSTVNLVVI